MRTLHWNCPVCGKDYKIDYSGDTKAPMDDVDCPHCGNIPADDDIQHAINMENTQNANA